MIPSNPLHLSTSNALQTSGAIGSVDQITAINLTNLSPEIKAECLAHLTQAVGVKTLREAMADILRKMD